MSLEIRLALISVTRLRIRHWRFLPGFFAYALRSALQARAAAGSLAVALANDARKTYWTCTIWESEEAMRAFMLSGAHRAAMPKLLHWCDEASVVRWTQAAAELPPWSEIHRRMQDGGRASKVAHPSANHVAYRIPAPELRPGQELRFK